MPSKLRTDLSPIELAMRIALAKSVSVQGLMDRYCICRASAYRYLHKWCVLHGVEGPNSQRGGENFWKGGDALSKVYSRRGRS